MSSIPVKRTAADPLGNRSFTRSARRRQKLATLLNTSTRPAFILTWPKHEALTSSKLSDLQSFFPNERRPSLRDALPRFPNSSQSQSQLLLQHQQNPRRNPSPSHRHSTRWRSQRGWRNYDSECGKFIHKCAAEARLTDHLRTALISC